MGVCEQGFKSAMLVATWALLCGVFSASYAQQTIFNVPSTDVLDKGKIYAEVAPVSNLPIPKH